MSFSQTRRSLTTTNPLGQVESRTVDYGTGQPLTITDVNGQTWRYTYDKFKRITQVRSPSESLNQAPTIQYSYDLSTKPYQIVTIRRPDTGDVSCWMPQVTRQFYDGVGQLIQEVTPGGDYSASGESFGIVRNIHYDSRGLKSWESVPRRVTPTTAFMSGEWQDASKPRTKLSYDALGRPSAVTGPDGATASTSYVGWTTRVTDQNGHVKENVSDAFGRLVQVKEYTGTVAAGNLTLYATTAYEYDLTDNLRIVTDTLGTTTEMMYDKLGRKTEMFDPNMGHWSYTYDAQGNLKTQTDAKNQTIHFAYDGLNRLTGKESPSGVTIAEYAYDANNGDPNSHAIGQRASMTDATGSTKWFYDDRGRVTKESKTIDGVTYDTTFSYDNMDRVTSTTYPGGETVSNTHDRAGHTYSVTGADPYLVSARYNGQGQIKNLSLSNGNIQTNFGYHGYNTVGWGDGYDNPYQTMTSFGRLWQIKTETGGQVRQSQRLDFYDRVGNIIDIVSDGAWMVHVYDDLDRLIDVHPIEYSPGTPETFVYNKTGNITATTRGEFPQVTKTYTYTAAHPQAVTGVVGSDSTNWNFSYDYNGNMTTGPDKTITWNVENKPSTITNTATGVTTTYAYDGDGKLTKKTVDDGISASATIHYVGNYYEKNVTTGEATKYYYADGRRIAMRKGSSLYYILSDHLGGTYAILNPNGTVVDTSVYYSFGESVSDPSGLATDKLYTGQQFQTETGLYNYGARFYDPYLMRWVQPDTIVPEPGNPQALNRYSYCYNNPTRYVDPTGHAASDLTYLVPEWFDSQWAQEWALKNPGKQLQESDYVYRFITMGIASNYSGEDLMRATTIAIGAGTKPYGQGLWSLPVDQTGLPDHSANWHQTHDFYDFALSPEDADRMRFGTGYQEYRWGKVRIVITDKGLMGRLTRQLGGGKDNATTFSAELIVFTKPLDFSATFDKWWLCHELRHVIQAQSLGSLYLPLYVDLAAKFPHNRNPMEIDANAFANLAGTGAPDRWD